MQKFKTIYGDTVIKYEVVKETEKQITFISKWLDYNKVERSREVRENKESIHSKWHDTFEDAKNYLIEKAEKKIRELERQTLDTKELLLAIQNLSEPQN